MSGFTACEEWQHNQFERRREAALGPVDCPECGNDSYEDCTRCNYSGKVIMNPGDYSVMLTMDHVRQIAEYRARRHQKYRDMICAECRDSKGRKSKGSHGKITEAMQSTVQQFPSDISRMVTSYLS